MPPENPSFEADLIDSAARVGTATAPAPLLPSIRDTDDAVPEYTTAEALGAAGQGSGLILDAVSRLASGPAPSTTLDPELDVDAVLKKPEYVELSAFVDEVYDRQDDSDRRFLLDHLLTAPNEEALVARTLRYRKDRERKQASHSAGGLVHFIGSTLGIAPDIVATAPLPYAAGAIIGSRLAQLGLVATVEAGVAAGERLVRAQRDATINGRAEALEAAAVTFGLIGVLGGGGMALQKALRQKVQMADDVFTTVETDVSRLIGAESGRSVGAAERETNLSEIRLSTQGESVAGKLLPDNEDISYRIRTPAGRTADLRARATNVYQETGDDTLLKAVNVISEVTGEQVPTVGPLGERQARMSSMMDAHSQGVRLSAAASHAYEGLYLRLVKQALGGRRLLSLDEFRRIAGMRAHGRQYGREVPIPNELAQRLNPQQLTALDDALDGAIGVLRKTLDTALDANTRSGRLAEGQRVENYVPLRLRGDVDHSVTGLANYFFKLFSRSSISDDIFDAIAPGRRLEGESIDDVARRDPELAREVADEFDALRNEKKATRRLEREAKATARANEVEAEAYRRAAENMQTRIDSLEAQVSRAASAARRAKAEARLMEARARLDALTNSTAGTRAKLVMKHAPPRIKSRLKAARTAAAKASALANTAAETNPLWEAALATARKHTNEPGLEVPTKGSAKSSSVQARLLDHSTMLDDPQFFEIYEADLNKLTMSHLQRELPRAHLAKAVREFAGEGDDEMQTALRLVDELFLDSIERAPDAATVKALEQQRKQYLGHLTSSMNAVLGLDMKSVNQFAADWTKVMTNAAASSLLGASGLAQVSDVVSLMGRGGRFTTGLRDTFTRVRRDIDNLDPADSAVLRVAILGEDAGPAGGGIREYLKSVDNVMANRIGLDAEDLEISSPVARNLQEKVLGPLAKTVGMVSLMMPVTNLVRRGMGWGIARQLPADMSRFAELPQSVRNWYLSHGIDDALAARLSGFMDSSVGTRNIRGTRVLDLDSLQTNDPDMFLRVEAAMNRMGAEATFSPSLATKPLWSRMPIGRLLLQLSSFTYTAGLMTLPDLADDFKNNPRGFRLASLTVGGFIASAMSLHLKTALQSEEAWEELQEQWTTAQGRVQLGQRITLGLFMLPGLLPSALENAMLAIGPRINEATGTDYLMESPSRFTSASEAKFVRAFPALSVGLRGADVLGDALNAVAPQPGQDRSEEAERFLRGAARLTPIINSLPVRAIRRVLED